MSGLLPASATGNAAPHQRSNAIRRSAFLRNAFPAADDNSFTYALLESKDCPVPTSHYCATFSLLAHNMSTYKGSTPSSPSIDPRIVDFYANFYRISDDPSEQAHAEYVESFTKDGTLVMGTKKAMGYDNILELRKGLWTGPVKKRLHHLKQTFPFGDNNLNVMLHGFVDYGLKNGKDVQVEWAARAVLVDEGGKLKMKDYQVYLDSAPVANAMKD